MIHIVHHFIFAFYSFPFERLCRALKDQERIDLSNLRFNSDPQEEFKESKAVTGVYTLNQ